MSLNEAFDENDSSTPANQEPLLGSGEGDAPAPEWATPDGDPETQKRGHVFFGLCCDTRRAVLIVNSINVVLVIAGIVSAAFPNDGVTVSADSVIVLVFQLIFIGVILYGAYKFVMLMVLLGLLWELFVLCYWIAAAATSIHNYDWSTASSEQKSGTIAFVTISVLWELVVIYADGAFVWDSHRGYMTEATYDLREKQSCCCV